jgi:hypothetical protein
MAGFQGLACQDLSEWLSPASEPNMSYGSSIEQLSSRCQGGGRNSSKLAVLRDLARRSTTLFSTLHLSKSSLSVVSFDVAESCLRARALHQSSYWLVDSFTCDLVVSSHKTAFFRPGVRSFPIDSVQWQQSEFVISSN